MLKLAALALAAASASTTSPQALVSSSPWWEKVTVKVTGDGQAQSCHYETSLVPDGAQTCDVEDQPTAAPAKATASGSPDELTSITFERRFSPGEKPDAVDMHAGDTLLGGQVMALAIDEAGEVQGCKVVAAAGDMTPDYGCDEAKAERFQASVGVGAESARQAYLTILVYGHSENVA